MMEKGRSIFGGGSGFLETAIDFTSRLVFDILFQCRLKVVVSLVFFTYVFSLFFLSKSFFCQCFINRLIKRKSVLKLTEVSINIFKINDFSFSFKLSGKEKVLLKKYDLQRKGVTREFLLEVVGVENISKKEGA